MTAPHSAVKSHLLITLSCFTSSGMAFYKTKMENYNLNGKRFVLIQNTENGEVNSETIFTYKQQGDLVTADYSGGTIRYGKIIADLQGDQLNMLYQCLTTGNELRAGKALAKISMTEEGKMK